MVPRPSRSKWAWVFVTLRSSTWGILNTVESSIKFPSESSPLSEVSETLFDKSPALASP